MTHTPECQAFEADLSALIDGELASEREAQVRAHLAGCDACSRQLVGLRRVDVALAGLPQPAVSPRLAQQLADRLRELERAQRAQAQRARSEAEPSEAGARKAGERRRAPARVGRRWMSARAAIASAAAAEVLALWFSLRGAEEPAPGAQVARAPAEIREPAPVSPREPVAERTPTAEPAAEVPAVVAEQRPAEPELGDLPDQDVLLLMRLEEVEDLDLLANLELLEALVAANPRGGSG